MCVHTFRLVVDRPMLECGAGKHWKHGIIEYLDDQTTSDQQVNDIFCFKHSFCGSTHCSCDVRDTLICAECSV